MPTNVDDRAELDQLAGAVYAALRAPSIRNTQPWVWQLRGNEALLVIDRDRRHADPDPDGRLLLLSCGAALHHAVVALGAAGSACWVDRLPDPDRPDLVARLRRGARTGIDPRYAEQFRAIYVRRTDRRPFSDPPPAAADLAALRAATERHGVHLHFLAEEAVPAFVAAVPHAAAVGYAESLVREDRTAGGDRQAGIRDAPGTVYAILFTDRDDRMDWLAAGEALSDVWLTLTGLGLAASPISAVVEVDSARQALRRQLSGVGYPAIALRIGVPSDHP